MESCIFNKIGRITVRTSKDIYSVETPTIFWISDICHAVIAYPNSKIFNPNLDYQIQGFDVINKTSYEPSSEIYEKYWNMLDDVPIFENDQNCIFWCAFYLHRIQKDLSVTFDNDIIKLQELEKWGYEFMCAYC